MIPRTHLAIVPVISVKCSLLPARNVRTFPFVIFRFLVKRRGFVMYVPGRQNLSGLYCMHGLAHLHAIHIDRAALWDSFERKLMLCGNGAHQSTGAPRACNSFTRRQIPQCDRHVISGMKLQNLFARQFRTPLHSLNYNSLRFPTARSAPHCPSSNAALPPGSSWKCRRAWSLPAPRGPPRIPPPTVRLCRRGSHKSGRKQTNLPRPPCPESPDFPAPRLGKTRLRDSRSLPNHCAWPSWPFAASSPPPGTDIPSPPFQS